MLNKTALRALLAAAIFAPTSNAISSDFSYNYLQATYISTTVDLGSSLGELDGNGFGVSGSFKVSPTLALGAGYGQISFDRLLGVDVDTSEFTFGILAHTLVAPKTDVGVSFSVINAAVEATDGFATFTDDDTGNVISVGLRHLLSNSVELVAGFSRVDVFDDTSTSFGFGARFYTSKTFSLGAGYSAGDDVESFLLNARIDI